ncbi:hypothetical protein CEXT_474061 [Caerostris extrusa]|uniref:Uncharacterized protein n=1 Tax=Caerostris extrusa TaxID=172846 RepID=A0AAV4T8T2_CAEEX|nr:hypothetical protein CEXT_474061 [Caerostris extrusa]
MWYVRYVVTSPSFLAETEYLNQQSVFLCTISAQPAKQLSIMKRLYNGIIDLCILVLTDEATTFPPTPLQRQCVSVSQDKWHSLIDDRC